MKRERIEIRPVRTLDEYRRVEQLQRTVWRWSDLEVTPLSELVVAQRIGGVVAGAFHGGKMIGFCMAVPALDDGTIYYHSRMLGILPEYQNRGLGLRLKLFQRSIARRRGISHIRWTFDPLQSRNAWLNVVKLGCTSREYLPNLYGKNSSLFNAGLETDRLIAEWRIDRSPKCNAPPDRLPPPTIESETGADGFRRPTGIRRVIGPRISLEIPENIDALKRSSLALARSWRLATRAAFQSAFRRGYVADGFLRRNDNGERRCFYLLSKRSR